MGSRWDRRAVTFMFFLARSKGLGDLLKIDSVSVVTLAGHQWEVPFLFSEIMLDFSCFY